MSKYPLLITHYLKKERIRHEFLTPEKVQSQHPTPYSPLPTPYSTIRATKVLNEVAN
ncbi:hypothetical protein Nos7524_3353 [Nostoc sp. PCC 7524]|nr:hypothetical protein Nos7524_3353 [Nostoc sp. PCC 7524]